MSSSASCLCLPTGGGVYKASSYVRIHTNGYVQKFKFRSSSKALTVVEIKAVIFSSVVNNNNGRV